MPDTSFTGRTEMELITTVVPVLQSVSDIITPLGSAFFVSDLGILITARHVIDGHLDSEGITGEVLGRPGEFFFILVPSGDAAEDQVRRQSVRITRVSLEPRLSDVAILTADMTMFPEPTRRHLKPWPLAHYRPTRGETCAAFGYANMKVGEPIDESGQNPDLVWQQQLKMEEGLVGSLYTMGRDSGLAPHPCFEALVQTDPGMSGGPVFTNNGLGGVVSTGMSNSAYSLASLISTCYHLGVTCDLGDGPREYMFNDLITRGAIAATGPPTGMRSKGERFEVLWNDGRGEWPET